MHLKEELINREDEVRFAFWKICICLCIFIEWKLVLSRDDTEHLIEVSAV